MADASRRARSTLPLVSGVSLLLLGASGLLGALIFLLVGGIFSAVFPTVFGTPMEDMRLDDDALAIPGELVAADPNPSMEFNGQPTVLLRYEYEVDDRPYEDSILVTADDPMARWTPGTALTVEILPDDPGVSRIQGGRAALAGWVGFMGLGFGALGLLATAVTLATVLAGIALLLVGIRRHRRAG